MKRILIILTTILFFASCERDLVFDTTSITAPELHVFVLDAASNSVNGATVNIYNSIENRDNNTGQLATGNTDNNGKAIFTEQNLKEAGIFYVQVIQGELSATAETPYLLLNDGHTYLNITIQ